jgi:6-pyruvoyltetrahydropterin/6-carboxytetrahydropterin synthase
MRDGHPCKTLHGHNYRVRLQVAADRLGDLDGFVIDYHLLQPFFDHLQSGMDHQNLNEALPGGGPASTAERLSKHLFVIATQVLSAELDKRGAWVHRVGVSETDKTWAWYQDTNTVTKHIAYEIEQIRKAITDAFRIEIDMLNDRIEELELKAKEE